VFSQDEAGCGGRGGKDDDIRKSADGVIKPSLPPDPNRKPEGKPTDIHLNDTDPTSGIRPENDAAVTLAQNGWRVEQNPDPSKLPDHIRASGHEPDYIIEGVVMDCYTPQSDTKMGSIWETIRKKVDGNQADGVVLNLDNRSDSDAVIKYLTSGDIGIQGIHAIIVVKGGSTFLIYPRE